MTIQDEARAEADIRGYLRGYQARAVFIQGYIAGALRPVTDDEVEAAWDALNSIHDTGRQAMRAALEAAREVSR